MKAIKAVLWSFLGIRKHSEYEADQQRLTLVQVVITGLLCALALVIALFVLVRFIVAK